MPTIHLATKPASADVMKPDPPTMAAFCCVWFNTTNPTTCRDIRDASLLNIPFGDVFTWFAFVAVTV
jgi:hypothetical protein